METHAFSAGDLVIYTMSKQSPHPGPRAREVHPSECGDDYSYVVDKFWIVVQMLNPQQVLLATRTGKTRVVPVNDPLLRRAGWWQKIRYRDRFPSPDILKQVEVRVPALAGN